MTLLILSNIDKTKILSIIIMNFKKEKKYE